MCLYPKLVRNPKYEQNQKNGGVMPPIRDTRVLYVPIGCGNCIECKKKKAREWQLRLMEEIKHEKNGKFITLTFSNESIKGLVEQKATKDWAGMEGLKGYDRDNEIARRAMRLFNKRWQKSTGKAIRHWTITELGHSGTENIHLHGIVWTERGFNHIRKIWQYGWIYPRENVKQERQANYVSAQTINYLIKYVTKVDTDHKTYKPIILTSPGMGKGYMDRTDWKRNKYKGKETNETYKTETGHKIALPIYWRNKIYTEEERELLWINKLDREERWVCGERVSIKNGEEQYEMLREYHRKRSTELGYGDDKRYWKQEEYELYKREMNMKKRLGKTETGEINTAEDWEAREYEKNRYKEYLKICEEIERNAS